MAAVKAVVTVAVVAVVKEEAVTASARVGGAVTVVAATANPAANAWLRKVPKGNSRVPPKVAVNATASRAAATARNVAKAATTASLVNRASSVSRVKPVRRAAAKVVVMAVANARDRAATAGKQTTAAPRV